MDIAKKLLSTNVILLLFIFLFNFLAFANYEEGESRTFIVTAYYSPLPNQENYLTGDYESEKRLNGEGIKGASGKSVFSGMLAAPKKYNFGTRIYLEGLGVGSVEDRGGAIVEKGKRGYEYDRIDVWVGYGDEGLKRALYWGKKTVKGKVLSDREVVSLDYKKIPSPNWATDGLKKLPNIFDRGIGVGADPMAIRNLQKFLSGVGLYNHKIDGIYNQELIDTVYNFQLNNGIVKNVYNYGAGYWGVRTRSTAKEMYVKGKFNSPQSGTLSPLEEKGATKQAEPLSGILSPSQGKETAKQVVVENRDKKLFVSTDDSNVVLYDDKKIIISDEKEILFSRALKGVEHTKLLQSVLKEMSLYDGEIDGNYDSLVDIIFDYQLNKGIVKNSSTPGAGNFGPITRKSLKGDYELYLESEQEKVIAESKTEERSRELEKLVLNESEEIIENLGKPMFGQTSGEVRELQVLLKRLGYFDYKDTAYFGPITKKALLDFQIDKGIISSASDSGAGSFGPKTKEILKESLKELLLEERLGEEVFNVS